MNHYERLQVDRKRLVGFGITSVLLVSGFLLGSRLLLGHVLPGPERANALFDRLRVTGAWGRLAPVEFLPSATPPGNAPVRGQRLQEILKRGSLKFGVTSDQIPWSFRNSRGEPVGLEADLAHALALSLGVRLELVPVERDGRGAALADGRCDVAAGRIKPDPVGAILYSRPLATERWAFLVRDHERDLYSDLARARQRRGLRIAVLDVPEWISRVENLLPEAQVTAVGSILEFVAAPPGRFDAMYTGYERGVAMSLLHPQFAAVVPSPDTGSVPFAFALPVDELALLRVVEAWIADAQAAGLVEEKLNYWVHGKGALAERGPRWSAGHDLLGWWP